MKVEYTLSIGFSSAKRRDVVDLPDDFTDEEIDEDYREWCANYTEGGWDKVEGDDE